VKIFEKHVTDIPFAPKKQGAPKNVNFQLCLKTSRHKFKIFGRCADGAAASPKHVRGTPEKKKPQTAVFSSLSK
jgi:hypothetical protein